MSVIERLLTNEKPYCLMSKEDQKLMVEIGKRNFLFFDGKEWSESCDSDRPFVKDHAYRLKPLCVNVQNRQIGNKSMTDEPKKSCINCLCLQTCVIYTKIAKSAAVVVHNIIDSSGDGYSEKYFDKLNSNFTWVNEELGMKCRFWREK